MEGRKAVAQADTLQEVTVTEKLSKCGVYGMSNVEAILDMGAKFTQPMVLGGCGEKSGA
jgi:hypothetical protein